MGPAGRNGSDPYVVYFVQSLTQQSRGNTLALSSLCDVRFWLKTWFAYGHAN
jgi:hypothetical protein